MPITAPTVSATAGPTARTSFRPARLARLLAVAAVIASPFTALAQVKQVDPYYVTVTANKLPMQCADLEVAYRVAELPAGQVLLIDGETAASLRAAYTPSMTAYVRADEIQVDAAGTSGKLVKESRLKAPHLGRGFVHSWSSILSTPLPVGTTLKVLEPAKADDGNIAGYRVPAPDKARGYIAKSGVRPATKTEIDTFKAAPAPTFTPSNTPAATPAPATPPKPTPTPATPTNTPGNTPGKVTDLTEPQIPGKGAPAPAAPTTTPAPTNTPATPTTTPTPEGAPVTVDQSSKNPPAETPAATPQANPQRPTTTRDKLVDLETSFGNVRRERATEAELQPLLTAYQNMARELDSSPENQRRRAQVQQRIDFLRLQQDWQGRLRKMESDAAALDSSANAVSDAIAEIEKTRIYNLVGQLIPSLVYDGKSLPLMYQVRTVGGPFSRTLGYIRPTPELKLESKTGLVVGVVGDSAVDPTLQLNIVTPIRIDVLKAATDAVRASTPTRQPTRQGDQPTATPGTQPPSQPEGEMLPPLPASGDGEGGGGGDDQ